MNHFGKLLLLTSLFCITLPNFILAQGSAAKGVIEGNIADSETKQALEFATISLLSAEDSSLINGVITDIEGRFKMDAPAGQYLLKIDFIAYQTRFLNEITVEANNSTQLGSITLSTEAQVMEAVEVRAEKSTMQMALDKKIFNVGKDLASTSGSAAEVLDNIPSVQVDIEGTVSLRGNTGVRILVDGKPSGLVGVRGTDGLRSLPANLIERVEVITNPSSKYEAEGTTGIINIVLKKDRRKGVNGSFDLSAGNPESAGLAFNINLRRNKLNFFSNYGFRYRQSPRINKRYQEFYNGDSTFIVDQRSDRTRGGLSHNFRFGADYFANEKNTLTTSFSYRISDNSNTSDIIYRNYINDFPSNLIGINTRSEETEEDEPNLEFALNHKKTYDRKGHQWSSTIQYRSSTESQFSVFEENFFDANFQETSRSTLDQRAANDEGESSLLLQSDYEYPFAKEGKIEFGYRGSFRRIDNDYLVEEFFDDRWNTLSNLSNDFNYDEDIHALYANIGNKVKRFSYQIGLRFEYSHVVTELLQTEEINDRNYTNLFPSAFLTYDLSEGNSLQVSYSRRLRRPRFWDLNPFFTFSDSRNIFRGNPNLDPVFTDSYELSYIRVWDKASISSSAYYRHSKGVIERILSLIEQNGELVTVRQPENLATSDAYGFEFIYTYDPYPWWRINGSANFFRSIVDGSNFRDDISQDAITWFTRVTSRMTIKKSVDVQIRANYRAPQNTTQGNRKSITTIDLGVNKDVFNGNGTFTLSIRDIFNSARYRSEVFGEFFYSNSNYQRRPRQITATLNYRLNQKKRRGGNRGNRGDGDFDGEGF